MKNHKSSRIDILENILIRLHEGAEPESVQDDFEEHFSDVSAIEIAGMEQQIIFDHDEVSFEDVLKLCNIHARTFENKVDDKDGYEIDHPGHPVRLFKEENHALNATLLRIQNILNALEEHEDASEVEGIYQGLANQYKMMGQFDYHYERKEKVFFPFLEKYGYQAPPKVMWAKDDEIRDLFQRAYTDIEALPQNDLQTVRTSFEEFEYEFKEMIFKEEAILLNMMLEELATEDWYQIAEESDHYHYAIIRPSEKWKPAFETDKKEPVHTPSVLETQQIPLGAGTFTLTFDSPKRESVFDQNALLPVTHGELSLNQIQSIFSQLPMDLTLIESTGKVVFHNEPANQKYQATDRATNALGENIEDVYPTEQSEKVTELLEAYSNDSVSAGTFQVVSQDVFKSYPALFDKQGHFIGMLEIAEDISNFKEIKNTEKTEFRKRENVTDSVVYMDLDVHPDPPSERKTELETEKISFAGGELTVTYEENIDSDPAEFPEDTLFKFKNGQLKLVQIEEIFNALPVEITFVDGDNIFKYFNTREAFEEMIFQRTPAQLDRHLEFCHPPRLWDRINNLIEDLKSGARSKESLWYEAKDAQAFVHITYQGMLDKHGEYIGTLELVRDVKPYQK